MKKALTYLFLFLSITLFSQSYHFLYLKAKKENGLAENDLYDLLQDKRGSIWMATHKGISVYDGVNFTQFNKESGLPSNVIHCLFEDVKGQIWIGTNRGLSVYDGVNFKTYTKANTPWRIVVILFRLGKIIPRQFRLLEGELIYFLGQWRINATNELHEFLKKSKPGQLKILTLHDTEVKNQPSGFYEKIKYAWTTALSNLNGITINSNDEFVDSSICLGRAIPDEKKGEVVEKIFIADSDCVDKDFKEKYKEFKASRNYMEPYQLSEDDFKRYFWTFGQFRPNPHNKHQGYSPMALNKQGDTECKISMYQKN